MKNSNEGTIIFLWDLHIQDYCAAWLRPDVSTQQDVLVFVGRKPIERSSDFQKLKIGPPFALQISAINYLVTQHIILEWRLRLHRVGYLKLTNYYYYVHQEARLTSGMCVENFFGLEFLKLNLVFDLNFLDFLWGEGGVVARRSYTVWHLVCLAFLFLCFCMWVVMFCWGDGRNILNVSFFCYTCLYLFRSIYSDYKIKSP